MSWRMSVWALSVLVGVRGSAAAVTVAVDPTADVHAISPLIYGLNFPSDAQISAGGIAVGRWGGNATTRYNYLIDVGNTAADYYFENIPGCWSAAANWCATPPADPKESSGANAFLRQMATDHAVAFLTMPTMGWVAKAPPKYGHPFDCGCPKTLLASQNSFDPYDPNCGDGLDPSTHAYLSCPPPSVTSTATTPEFAKAWATYLVGKFGPSNGQRIYALDNEPALWSSTHHDIRTTRLSYDELWQRMRDYATAILDADPTAEVAGPVEWGWPNYFCSDADVVSRGCSASSPDRAAHGGEELVAWLLDQAKAYEVAHGRRILHYLDLHYYPQGGSPPAITRSLWDPSYTDPSWINDKIRLVPRMRDWVSAHYPGTKLAISEYDFYDHTDATGAVTYAEVLGIFAREGLTLATAWSPPAPSDAAFAAYRLYRNFDGAGGHFEGTSVRATVSGGSGVQAYAAMGTTQMTVALVNETPSSVPVSVTLGSFAASGAPGRVYANGGGATLTRRADAPVAGGSVSLTLGPTTIAMLVVPGAGGGSTTTTSTSTTILPSSTTSTTTCTPPAGGCDTCRAPN